MINEHMNLAPLSAADYQLVLVCPSIDKDCGIGRYTHHAALAAREYFEGVAMLKSTHQALKYARRSKTPLIVIFEHEYSLVDFHHSLGEDDTTSSVISNLRLIQSLDSRHRVAIFQHAMVLHDHVLNNFNKQLFSAPIPIFHTTREGCAIANVNFTDLGVPGFGVTDVPGLPTQFTVGAFGFLSPNKDVESILKLCAATGAHIRANYGPSNSADEAAIKRDRERVLSSAKEKGVQGKLTFEFLTDEELREFLYGASIIYTPQHDFAHYSTSASARFPMSVGRGVIVPAHRCFHDLMAGVVFADHEKAISVVRELIASPSKTLALAKAALIFSRSTEIGKVYRSIADRLIAMTVWCGGNYKPLQFPQAREDIEEHVADLDDADELCLQNEVGFASTGRGLRGGFFIFDRYSKYQLQLIIKEFEQRSLEIADCLKSGHIEALLKKLLSQPEIAYRHLRAVRGGTSSYLSLVELIELPLYIQALVYMLELELSVDNVIILLRAVTCLDEMSALAKLISLNDALEAPWKERRDKFMNLTWGRPAIRLSDEQRQIIYPASLVSFNDTLFVKSAYRTILRRGSDSTGLETHLRLVRSGVSKADIVLAMSQSSEGKIEGVQLGAAYADWIKCEQDAGGLMDLCKVIAPEDEVRKARNIEYRDEIYLGQP